MKKKQRVELQRALKSFSSLFFDTMKVYIDFLSKHEQIDKAYFPTIFSSDEYSVNCYYSEDRKHIFIKYSTENAPFSLDFTKGNVFDVVDETGQYKNMPIAISIKSSSVNVSNISFNGAKAFDLIGENVEMVFDNLGIKLPNDIDHIIEYGIILSISKFDHICKDINGYVQKVALGYRESYLHRKFVEHKMFLTLPSRINRLELIKMQMEHYFFDEDVKELEIDNFILQNPLILEVALGLVKFNSQVVLEDQSGLFSNDLKPDLIAYNLNEKVWTIVDYKRSKSEVLKRTGQVRESIRSDVNDLIAQLRDYREYFSDSLNRDYYRENYGEIIEYPKAVGIIGRIGEDVTKSFNRQSQDFPRWVDIRPYNYIYDSFCRFIEVVESVKSI